MDLEMPCIRAHFWQEMLFEFNRPIGWGGSGGSDEPSR